MSTLENPIVLCDACLTPLHENTCEGPKSDDNVAKCIHCMVPGEQAAKKSQKMLCKSLKDNPVLTNLKTDSATFEQRYHPILSKKEAVC